ncbi:stage II sporulation protein D [Alkalicoccobacillus murimartini]|uniref:Stage II sporulation protein D n=1 Tax=Alkalicoccobacillus murimartini TaxID=171685 RepID=A0ABT9YH53_9BACI|nr:stage II sporulation protein D [Alkalicoccobacillus murimartini]MDQ0207026.1 stage II sporulation protein D [Alkalicoccobacillus murimartini]
MKRFIWMFVLLFVAVLIIPSAMVAFFSEGETSISAMTKQDQDPGEDVVNKESKESSPSFEVSVFRSKKNSLEQVPLEDYVTGVVSAEMLPSFEMEALKAQALAARTFILKLILNEADTKLPEGAIVTDTITHQVYQDEEELRQKWGQDYESNFNRVKEAVAATAGEIITYDNEPISAQFFSTSNGFTENSEDYYENSFPYLRSVESPWDQNSPRFSGEKEFSDAEIEQSLGVTLPSNGTIPPTSERTDGGRVASVTIGDKTITGREVRTLLKLDSSDFDWQRSNGTVTIKTKGWGHGVGMSQYGADGMAKDGITYDKIIQHYYQGIEIAGIDHFAEKVTAKLK